MVQVNLAIGLAVLILFQVALFLGGRAVFKHHKAEDERRAQARAQYSEKLANLLGRKNAPVSPGVNTVQDAQPDTSDPA